jgi:hypothetical protein
LEAPHLGVNHRLAANAGISPEVMRESILAAAPRSGDARAEAPPRLPIFGQAGFSLGGGRPFTFVPPRPPPLPSQPSRRPLDDEIPINSGGRATSLAAEMRASSIADVDRTPGPTTDSPSPVKEEADEEEQVPPHIDARVWNAEGDTLEEMDLTGGPA